MPINGHCFCRDDLNKNQNDASHLNLEQKLFLIAISLLTAQIVQIIIVSYKFRIVLIEVQRFQ